MIPVEAFRGLWKGGESVTRRRAGFPKEDEMRMEKIHNRSVNGVEISLGVDIAPISKKGCVGHDSQACFRKKGLTPVRKAKHESIGTCWKISKLCMR